MVEKWKDVVGYEGYYQVSDQGRVRSVDRVVKHKKNGPTRLRGRILQPSPRNKCGHLSVVLSKDNVKQALMVHTLVTRAWLGLCPEGMEVRHGVGKETDNRVENLCYGTRAQQYLDRVRDGTQGRKPVRRSDGVEFINVGFAARETRGNHSHICAVCRGQRKTAGGYGWEYVTEKSNV